MPRPAPASFPPEIERVFQQKLMQDIEVSDAELRTVFEWAAPMLSGEQREYFIWELMTHGLRAFKAIEVH